MKIYQHLFIVIVMLGACGSSAFAHQGSGRLGAVDLDESWEQPERSSITIDHAQSVASMEVEDSALPTTANRLPISPLVLSVPAGASGRFKVAHPPPAWNGNGPLFRSVSSLPTEVAVRYVGSDLQIDTPGQLRAATYGIELTVSTAEQLWSTPAILEVLPCNESKNLGLTTATMANDGISYGVGGAGSSTHTSGIGSPPLLFCDHATARKLRVTIESVTLESGERLDRPRPFALYRSLIWPPSTSFLGGGPNPIDSNVMPVAQSQANILEWDIQPGAYVLHFQSRPRHGPDNSQPEIDSLTYRVDVVEIKTIDPEPRILVLVDHLNIRQGPGTQFTRIGQVNTNDILTVTGRNADASWFRVCCIDGKHGWVINLAQYVYTSGNPYQVQVVGLPTPLLPACSIPVNPDLKHLVNQTEMGCAVGPGRLVWSAWESFERGHMLWRSDTGLSYYFVKGSGWGKWNDPWREGLPIPSRGSAPQGLVAPIRGFGYAWGRNEELFRKLGWATDQEKGFCARIQEFEQGFVLRSDIVSSCLDGLYNTASEPDFGLTQLKAHNSGYWQR